MTHVRVPPPMECLPLWSTALAHGRLGDTNPAGVHDGAMSVGGSRTAKKVTRRLAGTPRRRRLTGIGWSASFICLVLAALSNGPVWVTIVLTFDVIVLGWALTRPRGTSSDSGDSST